MGARTAMIMGPQPMSIDPRLITLTQWLSPAYPMGSFAFSHGLESAISDGVVGDADSLKDWLEDLVSLGSARCDACFIQRAAVEEIDQLAAEARAFAASFERLREAEKQGAAFARVTREVWGLDLPNVVLPVALGSAAGQINLEIEAVVALYLHSFASNLCSAAQRLMPLGQTDAQIVLNALTPTCAQIAQEVSKDPTPWSITWTSDIAAMRHETLQTRLFQS